MLITIPITEINPIVTALSFECTMKNRIDVRSNSIVNPIPLFLSLFSQSFPLIFLKSFLPLFLLLFLLFKIDKPL